MHPVDTMLHLGQQNCVDKTEYSDKSSFTALNTRKSLPIIMSDALSFLKFNVELFGYEDIFNM